MTNKERLDSIENKLSDLENHECGFDVKRLEVIEEKLSSVNTVPENDGIKELLQSFQGQIDSLAEQISTIQSFLAHDKQVSGPRIKKEIGVMTNDVLGGEKIKPFIEGDKFLDERGNVVEREDLNVANANLQPKNIEFSRK